MEHKYYVTATDKFMSGWGMASKRISKMVAICNDYKRACEIEEMWDKRNDLCRVNITPNKPYYRPSKYHTSWYDGETLSHIG